MFSIMKSPKIYVNVLIMKRVFSVFFALISTAIAGPISNFEQADKATFGLIVDGELTGSGFIIDPAGFALTAAHQIALGQANLYAQSIHLDGERLEVIALDRGRDVALVKLKDRKTPYPSLKLAARTLTVAQPIYLLATANYRHNLLLSGRVARTRGGFEYFQGLGHYVTITYVSANAPSGTSGGPWLNTSGQVVGMQMGLMHTGKDTQPAPVGVTYMVPIADVKALVDERASIRRPSLRIGLEELWEQDTDYRQHFPMRRAGLVVARISKASRAYRAGLRRGHLIVAIDGQRVSYREHFLKLIRQKRVADHVTLTLIGKNGPKKTISVVLDGI
ncbi:MAG: hypothetical protein CMH52_11595 [Myxococcales bacterium]|nr:hypothetical protein [Myxococcales bacterium]